MVDKELYLQRFRELYRKKNGKDISDDLAMECFEKLISLVGAITSHTSPRKIIIHKHGKRK